MTRQTMLERIRQAATAGRSYRVHPEDIPPDVGYVGAGEDLCASMAAEIDNVGGSAHLVDDMNAARETLAALLRQYNPHMALCWQHPLLDRLGLADLLHSHNVTASSHDTLAPLDPDEQRSRMLAADIGISSADYAIAETGSLVVYSRPGQERVASLLPPVHVAIVEQSQIVPDLLDVFEKLDEAGMDCLPSNLVLITGPSKTGDLELQLTTGVHGPGKWHVIVVRRKGTDG